MAAANTDRFKKAKRRFSTTIAAGGFAQAATTLPLTTTTGLDTDTAITLVIDPGGAAEEVITGVVSGSKVINCVRGKEGTSDQDHSAGDAVTMYFTETHWDDLVDGILNEHNQDGTHSDITADSGTFTTLTVTGTATSQGWTPLGDVPDTVTANGNRNYDLVFNGNDLTGTLSPGMKLQLTRTVAAPTKCADLEASSSQYFSKTSPSGISFTTTFTCSAWVKLESYSSINGIIARRNADTEGFSFAINTAGQLELQALRIASNNKVGISYASIPLNKWVHVAASMDVSVAGNASTLMYIDGVLVDSSVTTNGTCTALVQGTTALVVGAHKSAGTNPFDGKIAQAAVFSSVLSAATIRSYMSQGLSGSESTLVSAYSFNDSINDLSANANNLSAQNSAVATATDSPFANAVTAGTLEYAEINSVSFSTNTTVNVRVPDTCQIPTTGGISAVSYSTQSNPYGLPYFSKVLGSQIIQSSQTTTTTLTDRFSIPVYVPANARLRATLVIPTAKDSGASGGTSSRIFQDGTSITYSIHYPLAANVEMRHTTTTILEPTPGTHTYTVSMNEVGGVGTATFGADSTYPIRFWVELA